MASLPQRSALSGYDLSWDRWLNRAYALPWDYLIYALIFFLAVFSRFYELGDRVMSHDESLHTYYSWRLYDAGDFQHTPLMHGPVLFHAVAFFYFLFGDSDFSARIYAALLGVGMVMFPLLWRRWLGRWGAMTAAIGILISPMLMYYNRYIREDTPNLFFVLLMVHAILHYLDGQPARRPQWLWVLAGSFLMCLASKETAFMYALIFITFLGFYWLLRLSQESPLRLRNRAEVRRADWRPSLAQQALGQMLVLGAAGVFGYVGGYLLYYWQFAQMSWLWVFIGMAMALGLRVVPLVYQTLSDALQRNRAEDIVKLLLMAFLLFGLIFFIYGALGYNDNQQALNNLGQASSVVITTPQTQTPAELESARNAGAALAGLGLLVVLGSLAGLGVAQISLARADENGEGKEEIEASVGGNPGAWFLYTGLWVLGTGFFLAILRLLTLFEFGLRDRLVQIILIVLFFVLMQSLGLIRSLIAGASRPGLPQMFTEGLSRPKSASMMIIGGTILGAVLAVYMYGVLDIIKPSQVWVEQTNTVQINNPNDPAIPFTETQTSIQLNSRLGNALLLWMGLPLLLAVLLVLFVAMAVTPRHLPLPWQDIGGVLFVALVIFAILGYIERHTLEDTDANVGEPVAVDPNADGAVAENEHHDTLIIGSAFLMLMLASGVVFWRLTYPQHWEYLNRQPAFDLLILVTSLIVPWFSAYPIWLAGYTLDAAPLPPDTTRVSIIVTGSFLIFAAAVGLSWNWKQWLISNAVFLGLFFFFFTTMFTNGAGVFTGMVGSLGYWLEQQGVRRGSQPQYYYTLIQIPVYEFLPAIMASLAGVAGLAQFFRWRNESLQAEAEAALRAEYELDETQADMASPEDTEEYLPEEVAAVRPYSDEEEADHRENEREWLGAFPFLQFAGYWTVIILISLTIAGEKMPWLTTHISLPMILLGAWYVGQMAEKLPLESLRRGGWILMAVLIPALTAAAFQVLDPMLGGAQPFAGQSSEQLQATNEWIAAFVVLAVAVYFIRRLGLELGWPQMRRLAFLGATALLGLITARAAVLASFQNYDHPTEFLVYAHSGGNVKMTLDEVIRLAERSNEGYQMKVAYDDDSSWPMTWYLRDFQTTFFAGDAASFQQNPGVVDDARVVIVGSRKNTAVETVLGDGYYRFDYKRLWWPMQEYFNLSYDRVAGVFAGGPEPTGGLFRQGIWDIWWNRDYDAYGQAQCVESRLGECATDANPGACYVRIESDCQSDNRYDLNRWPVSDALYLYVDKEIAAQIWDAGIGGPSVAAREPLNAIDRVAQDLAPLTTFGVDAALSGPRGVAVGPDGLIYVADTDKSRIAVFDSAGVYLRDIGRPSTAEESGPGTVLQPWGVEVGPDANLYVADTWNHRVQVFNPAGEALRFWGEFGILAEGNTSTSSFWGPRDITLDLEGNVLVADTGNKRVRVYSPDGVWLRDIGVPGSGLGQLEEPVGLAVNPVNGELYVADTWNQRVQVFSPAGVALRAFALPMWYDSRNSADRPFLSFSPDGAFLAITDMNAVGRNDGPRVVVYDLATNPVLAFNAPDTDVAAGLYGLRIVGGLQFGPDGALYVADAETGRVLKFPPLPLVPSILPSPLNNTGAENSGDDTGVENTMAENTGAENPVNNMEEVAPGQGAPLAPGEVNSNSFGVEATAEAEE